MSAFAQGILFLSLMSIVMFYLLMLLFSHKSIRLPSGLLDLPFVFPNFSLTFYFILLLQVLRVLLTFIFQIKNLISVQFIIHPTY